MGTGGGRGAEELEELMSTMMPTEELPMKLLAMQPELRQSGEPLQAFDVHQGDLIEIQPEELQGTNSGERPLRRVVPGLTREKHPALAFTSLHLASDPRVPQRRRKLLHAATLRRPAR
ncbi:hypothetical protein INR49_005648 [Caranx melampygus]|nr:hypothetical protein INR49_005648 [Caranx melampygus]